MGLEKNKEVAMNAKPRLQVNVSELILSGILFTLLGVVFEIGWFASKVNVTIEDHDKRLAKIENNFPLFR